MVRARCDDDDDDRYYSVVYNLGDSSEGENGRRMRQRGSNM